MWPMPLSRGRIAVLGPTAGANEFSGGREVVGFAAQKNEIERLAQRLGRDGRRRRQIDVAERAADDQPGLGQLRRAPRPHQKRHVAAGVLEPAAEIAADRAGADHENTHRSLLVS